MKPQFHLADLFEIVALAIPDRVALMDGTAQLTYADLNQRSDDLAAGLYQQGVKRGQKVGLYLLNGSAYLESFLAVIKVGAVPFNVNYRYGLEELQYLFSNADAEVIIHGDEFSSMVQTLKQSLPTIALTVVVNDGQGRGNAESGSIAYEQLCIENSPSLRYDRDESDYLIQYTGGTTGMPKGVMWPHKSFLFACLGGGGAYAQKPPISTPQEIGEMAQTSYPLKVMPMAPLMHGAAMWTALSGLLGGITLVLDPLRAGFQAEDVWSRVESDQVNVLQIVGDAMGVPLLASLKAAPGRWDLSSMVRFGSGGAVFSKHVKKGLQNLLPNTDITDGLGSSETGISGMGEAPKNGGFMRVASSPTQQVVEDGCFVGVGETGLLATSGYTPIGYYNDPVKSAEVFQTIDDTLWVVTGDQARLDDDGFITVLGRGSTCINSGGEKIYPEEVEETLKEYPAIYDAVVVGMPDEKWGQAVTALVSIVHNTTEPSLDEIRSFCRNRLASYKIPRSLVVIDAVRRSPAGKQDYTWAKKVLTERS